MTNRKGNRETFIVRLCLFLKFCSQLVFRTANHVVNWVADCAIVSVIDWGRDLIPIG